MEILTCLVHPIKNSFGDAAGMTCVQVLLTMRVACTIVMSAKNQEMSEGVFWGCFGTGMFGGCFGDGSGMFGGSGMFRGCYICWSVSFVWYKLVCTVHVIYAGPYRSCVGAVLARRISAPNQNHVPQLHFRIVGGCYRSSQKCCHVQR